MPPAQNTQIHDMQNTKREKVGYVHCRIRVYKHMLRGKTQHKTNRKIQ